jgi:predicted nucleic-acid-binding protein
MIGLDTNVILRYVSQDDALQTPVAARLFESFNFQKQGFITIVALVEAVWVLRSSYDASREHIRRTIETLLRTRGVVVERSDLVWLALGDYSQGNADFGDCLIQYFGRAAGCDYTVTFDRDAVSSAGMKLLK